MSRDLVIGILANCAQLAVFLFLGFFYYCMTEA